MAATLPLSVGVQPHRYRWVVLLLCWGAFLMSFVDRVAWSTVAAPVGASLGIKVALLGSFVTTFYVGYVLMNLFGAPLSDWLGGRLTMGLSLLPLGVLTFMFGGMTSLSTGMAIQFLMGIAAGGDYAAGMKLLPNWFIKDRGRALGLFTTGTATAMIVTNLFVPHFSATHGWQQAFHVLGIVTFVWGALSLLFLRDVPPGETPHARVNPFQALHLLKERDMIVMAVVGFGGFWATVGFAAWGNALLTRHWGIPPVEAGSIVAFGAVGAIISKPTLGWISDLPGVSRRLVTALTLFWCALLLVVFGLFSTPGAFFWLAPLVAIGTDGYLPVLMAQISDKSGRRYAGAAAGWANAVWQLGGVMAPMVIGSVYAATHSFAYTLAAVAVGPLVAGLAMLFVSKSIART